MFTLRNSNDHFNDRGFISFIILSSFSVLTLIIMFISVTFLHLYKASAIITFIELVIVCFTFIFLISIILINFAIIMVCKFNFYKRQIISLVKLGMFFLMPILFICTHTLMMYQKDIHIFYITLNNLLVKSMNKKYLPQEIMILLPHCLQDSTCPYKVVNCISNCQRCGKCPVGHILEAAQTYQIQRVEIVSGGTIARNIVSQVKPKLIIAIACERDLVSGIADVKGIPVFGQMNQRPNGDCFNTKIDLIEMVQNIESFILIG